MSVLGVQSIPDDVIHRFSSHEGMWYAGLAVQDGARIPQLSYHFTLKHLLLPGPLLSFKRVDPAYIAHCRLHASNVKLVFERNRHPVERTNRGFVLSVIRIKFPCILDGCIEKNFVQTMQLDRLVLCFSFQPNVQACNQPINKSINQSSNQSITKRKKIKASHIPTDVPHSPDDKTH